MKIGLNARFLCQPFTGIGQYTENLLLAMAKLDSHIKWVIVVPKKIPKSIQLPKSITPIVLPEKKWKNASFRKFYWEQVQVPRLFKKEKVDLAHYPYPCNPRFSGHNAPQTIVTVHDSIPWTRPEYRRRIRTRLYQRNAKKALEKADHIICVSQSTAFTISDHIKFPYSHITVVHNAASPIFTKRTQKYRHAKPFFLYVGGYDERKNVIRLIEAFQEYIAPKYDIDLILVGAKNRTIKHYTALDRLQKLIKSSKVKVPHQKIRGRIRTTSSLSAEKLAGYYRSTRGFVNVSLAEGFNIPLLEAATCEAPIITSDIPIHHEIIGKNGLFCDPYSTKNIGETLLNFLRDENLQKSLIQNSKKLKKQYSWESSAQKTLELYKTFY